ncbi:MAG: metal ABC transporter substrate-binding protein [Actinomycetota bacterium]
MLRSRFARALVCAALTAVSCGGTSESGDSDDRRPHVVAAFYPLAFAAGGVGGDAVRVDSLTPGGVEPHDLELSSGQVRDIAEADLVVYLGHGFQPAVEDVVASLDASRRFDALEGKSLLPGVEEGEQTDPHIWLDPTIMATIADQIAARLGALDPGGTDGYESNAEALKKELLELDRDYSDVLSNCRSNEFVTSHAAFGYLAARYRLRQTSIAGVDPEGEPSPGRLAEVALFVEEHAVTTIFFEELAPPDLAETLARETGARAEVLSPLETPPERGDYLDVMRTNLDKMREALGCE